MTEEMCCFNDTSPCCLLTESLSAAPVTAVTLAAQAPNIPC